ncbi:endolytic transglycosylase MltG [Zhihengliuella salsuginis]|uniref:Endolytic murein transglycosylase n=1 Tax=Zhihengliuella salsuginis TaxID=578222 RepID=A0ABQ3GMT6_9MICC|nr:endolytic transglycosylase MltG [Zhihengliuella salsuginis]GHD12159.1 hypothetical protein GCM10008096_27310 [Zhihengliuella salsuginis]
MNDQQDSPRRRRAAVRPAVTESEGAPFRRLRSGRRRSEPTAPHDPLTSEPAAAGHDPADDYPVSAGEEPQTTGPDTTAAGPEEPSEHEDQHDDTAPEAGRPEHPEGTEDAAPAAVSAEDAPVRPPELEAALAMRRKRRRRRNAIMVSVFAVFVVAVTVAGLYVNGLLNVEPEDFDGPGQGEVDFVVAQGWGPNRVGDELVAQGVVASRDAFLEALSAAEGDSKEVHPGEYPLQTNLPAREAVDVLLGVGSAPVHYIAIDQNSRLPAALENIAESTDLDLGELQELAAEPETFGLDASYENIEGFLHPGEYRFPVEDTAQEVLQMLVDATTEKLAELGATDPQEAYRALTIASILQGEARTEDYAVVAGAIENRLNPDNSETGGLLQVDSSVIYGLDRYTLEFTAEEKADASNPYNTYQHQGLPPTPIGSPGDAAIEAAVNPDDNGYYYWVTVNIETGETKFAETYAEHRGNQQEYRDYCAANPEVCS